MRNKTGSFGASLLWGLYFAVSAGILALVLLRGLFDYTNKLFLPVPDCLLLLAALAAVLAGTALLRRFRTPLRARFGGVSPALFFFFFFLLQVYICYNCYFETGWDATVVTTYAERLASREFLDVIYFQRYENNILVTVLFSLFIRLSRYIGILDVELNPYMAIITGQCALSCLTGWLIWHCAFRLWKRRSAAWATSLLYCVLAGLSPWMMIPYTDATSLIVPMLVLYLYLSMENRRRLPLKWAAMGALAYWGYRLKPQCAICVIAVLLLKALEMLREDGVLRHWRTLVWSVLSSTAVFCLSAVFFSQVLLPAVHVVPDKNLAYVPAHFIMMGLSDESDGAYNDEDASFTSNIQDGDEKTREDLARAAQRIRDYGPVGLLAHTAKKTLVNFADGTFAWSCEGNFYANILDPKNRFVSPLLRSLCYQDGQYHSLLACFEQALWLFVLAAPLGLLTDKKARENRALRLLALSILGLILFETLFEARARYLFLYTPYFTLLAAAGWKSLLPRLQMLREKRRRGSI